MAEKILINGKATTVISSFDRGLQYGDGVFETIAIDKGQLLCWDEHIKRLELGCKRLNLPTQDSHILKQEGLSLIDSKERGILKIIITRGQGGRGYNIPADADPSRIISLYPFPEYPENIFQNGISTRICDYRYTHNERLAGIKHLNRLEQVLARSEWSDPTIAEGIVLDSNDNVIEGTMSNIFCVIDSVLYTSNLRFCGIEGIIRNKILELSPSLEIKAAVNEISLTDLKKAEEIFCCNSVIGIWPVVRLENHKFPVGNITKKINQALLESGCIPS